jgi:hypothetical protein
VSKTQSKKTGKIVSSCEGTSTGEYEKEEQEIGKKRRVMRKESPKTRWKMQRERD